MCEERGTGQAVDMNETRQLRRTKQGRMIAGVCSGVGQYFGIDPNIIRVALAVLTLFGGAGIAAYAIGWLLLPEEDRSSIVQDLINKQQHKTEKKPADHEEQEPTRYPYQSESPQSTWSRPPAPPRDEDGPRS